MFIQLRLSQAAKEDKIPSLAQKSMIKHNDYLVNQSIGVNEEKTEVIKDHDKISQIVKGLQRPAYEVINAAPVPEAT